MSTANDRDPLQTDDHLLKRSLTPTDPAAGPCLDAETLASWADGSTPMAGTDEIERHLASCARCQAMLAAFANADVAEASHVLAGAAAVSTHADRASKVVPFKPAWRQWAPIALGAVAASLVVYAAWPKHTTPPLARAEQTTANALRSPQVPQLQTEPPAAGLSAPAAKAPTDALVGRQARSSAADRPAPPPPTPAPVAAPEPLRAPASALPPGATGATRGVTLAAPPPATIDGVVATAKPTELNMLRAVEESTLTSAKTRVIAEFSSPTTPSPSPTQSLIGRTGAGGGGGGRGAGGAGFSGIRSPASNARVSWRVLASGQVERSATGGSTWSPVTITPPATIVSGAAPSATVCWLIGRTGIVLLSTDGMTFRRVASPDVADLRSITAIDEMEATVTTIDGRVFKTEDGGSHWKEGER